jgi:hypothetical protein
MASSRTMQSLDDPEAFHGYERRILENVTADPELAIGSSKELVEALCSLLLEEASVSLDKDWSAEKLFKEALKTDLSVDAVPDSKAGADSISAARPAGAGSRVRGVAPAARCLSHVGRAGCEQAHRTETAARGRGMRRPCHRSSHPLAQGGRHQFWRPSTLRALDPGVPRDHPRVEGCC